MRSSIDRRVEAEVVGAARVAFIVPSRIDRTMLTRHQTSAREVLIYDSADDLNLLHDRLSTSPHQHVVVDLGRGPGAAHRAPALLAHVAYGGTLLIAVPQRPSPRQRLLELVEEVATRLSQPLAHSERRRDLRPPAERDFDAFALSIASIEQDEDFVSMRKSVLTVNVVPERRFDSMLEKAPAFGRVEAVLPPSEYRRKASFVSSNPDERTLTSNVAPRLSLRSFEDVVVGPRMVAYKHDTVLPHAFRNTEHARPRTPVLAEWTRWAVRPRQPDNLPNAESRRLSGTWFHADCFIRGHFGHSITEQLSQLWAWPEVLALHPDAGLLLYTDRGTVPQWELDLLEAAGVDPERVRGVDRPVQVEHLLSATPGYVILRHIHPSLRPMYAGIGQTLEGASSLQSTPDRVFIDRSGQRRCHEASDIALLHKKHGFTIVRPEDHPLPDQVAIFRNANVVHGYGGSGMFHLLFGGNQHSVVAISHSGYHMWNEKAIAALWDLPLTLVRGTPDITTEHFTQAAMHSDYNIDMAEEGQLLREALVQLD